MQGTVQIRAEPYILVIHTPVGGGRGQSVILLLRALNLIGSHAEIHIAEIIGERFRLTFDQLCLRYAFRILRIRFLKLGGLQFLRSLYTVVIAGNILGGIHHSCKLHLHGADHRRFFLIFGRSVFQHLVQAVHFILGNLKKFQLRLVGIAGHIGSDGTVEIFFEIPGSILRVSICPVIVDLAHAVVPYGGHMIEQVVGLDHARLRTGAVKLHGIGVGIQILQVLPECKRFALGLTLRNQPQHLGFRHGFRLRDPGGFRSGLRLFLGGGFRICRAFGLGDALRFSSLGGFSLLPLPDQVLGERKDDHSGDRENIKENDPASGNLSVLLPVIPVRG